MVFKQNELKEKFRCRRTRRDFHVEEGKHRDGSAYLQKVAAAEIIREQLTLKRDRTKAEFQEAFTEAYQQIAFESEAGRQANCDFVAALAWRYCASETRTPGEAFPRTVSTGVVHNGEEVEIYVAPTFVFDGEQDFSLLKKKRKGCRSLRPDVRRYIEVVRLNTGKPRLTEKGRTLDTCVDLSLSMYAGILYTRSVYEEKILAGELMKNEDVTLVYTELYLRKKNESDSELDESFFEGEHGGHVISLMERVVNGNGQESLDVHYRELLKGFLEGEEDMRESSCCERCELVEECGFQPAPVYLKTPVSPVRRVHDIRLTPTQDKIVTWTDGTLCVNAGPGAGKTTTLMLLIYNWILDGVPVESIKAFTFTNNAARELQTRLVSLLKAEGEEELAKKVAASTLSTTFHAEYLLMVKKLYRELGYACEPKLIDTDEMKLSKVSKIAELVQEQPVKGLYYLHELLDVPAKKGAVLMAEWLFDRIREKNYSKNEEDIEALKKDVMEAGLACSISDEQAYRVIFDRYNLYDDWLYENGLVTFSDIERQCDTYLEQHPYYLDDSGISHVIVDEVQDTNNEQFRFIRRLTETPDQVATVVVGDGDQSVYAWRGANVDNIRNIDKLLNRKVVVLNMEENFRSVPPINDLANAVIGKNQNRLPKQIKSMLPSNGPEEVVCKQFQYTDKERDYLASCVAAAEDPDQVAVITRNNGELLQISSALSEKEIPWNLDVQVAMLENSRVKSVLSLASFFEDPTDTKAGLEYLNALYRGGILSFSDEDIRSYLERFRDAVQTVEASRAELFFMDLVDWMYEPDEVLDAFLDALERQEGLYQKIAYCSLMRKYGEPIRLRQMRRQPGVILTTAHSSKGMEFDTVILVVDKFGGHVWSEEERRLLFVAITRARKKLIIVGRTRTGGNAKTGYTYNLVLKELMEASGFSFVSV